MGGINLNDTPYGGRTAAAQWNPVLHSSECSRCGSALRGRREAVERITTTGVCLVRETFRCRCGRGHHVERQERAA